jgi:hypothetical protein
MHPFGSAIFADLGELLLFPISLSAIAFWVWMIVDCARHETSGTMIAWLLAILFAGVIAAPLYFFLRRLPRRRRAQFHRVVLALAITRQLYGGGSAMPHLYQPWQKDQRIG